MRYILAVFLFLGTNLMVMAGEAEKREIMDRCRSQMNEYGASIVKACVDQDLAAFAALSKYPKEYQAIVDRCMSAMREYGFSIVKACADQDIEAEKSLSNY